MSDGREIDRFGELLDAGVLKELAVWGAAFAVHMAAYFAFTLVWNYDQGHSVIDSIGYFRDVGHGWLATAFPAFVIGVIAFERLTDFGGFEEGSR